jgi:hypothetical protein
MIEHGGGTVVAVPSTGVLLAGRGLAVYYASKGALLQLVCCVAVDHGRQRRRPSVILPDALVRPEDVAELVMFFPGDAAIGTNVTGILIDGGLTRPSTNKLLRWRRRAMTRLGLGGGVDRIGALDGGDHRLRSRRGAPRPCIRCSAWFRAGRLRELEAPDRAVVSAATGPYGSLRTAACTTPHSACPPAYQRETQDKPPRRVKSAECSLRGWTPLGR